MTTPLTTKHTRTETTVSNPSSPQSSHKGSLSRKEKKDTKELVLWGGKINHEVSCRVSTPCLLSASLLDPGLTSTYYGENQWYYGENQCWVGIINLLGFKLVLNLIFKMF